MEAVLVRASSIAIARCAPSLSSVGAAADSSRKGLRQSGFLATQQYRSQVEMLGPSRILWNSGNSNNDQPRRNISEECLESYERFLNYETLDGSVAEEDVSDDVVHTRESFDKFLRHYPAAELKLVSQACYLSNLAYIIGDIKVR
jgi:hypothetical protein